MGARHLADYGMTEDLAFLAGHGVGLTEAARRTGMHTADNLEQWLRRRHLADLCNQLRQQEPLALVPSRKDR